MAEISCAASFFSNKCFTSQVFAGVLSGRHRFKSSAIFSLLTILNFDYWRCSSYCWHQDILEQTLHALTCLHYRCCGLVSLCLSCSENALSRKYSSPPHWKNIYSTASKSATAFTFIHYSMNQRNFLRAHSKCISCDRPHTDREVTIIKRSGSIGDHRLAPPPSKDGQVNQIYGQVCT